jgi:hypothetical protein
MTNFCLICMTTPLVTHILGWCEIADMQCPKMLVLFSATFVGELGLCDSQVVKKPVDLCKFSLHVSVVKPNEIKT